MLTDYAGDLHAQSKRTRSEPVAVHCRDKALKAQEIAGRIAGQLYRWEEEPLEGRRP